MSDLLTASAVVNFFGIPSGDTAIVSAICNRVDDIMAGLCNRPNGFLSAAHTETLDGEASDRFVLTYTPIAQSPAPVITVDQNTVSSDLYTIKYKTGIVGMKEAVLTLWASGRPWGAAYPPTLSVQSPNFGWGFENVSVAYTGGYGVVPLPGDLVQCAMDIVNYVYRNRTRDPALKAENLGDYGYTVGVGAWDEFIKGIRETLDRGGHIRHSLA